ncbi:GNAT family N-acetyltransferase [bacterium]|nr:GNAT family N-acetyltransferase [bacterium]
MFRLTVDEELELRLLEPRHAPELFALVEAHRAHIREWVRTPASLMSVEDAHTYIERSLKAFAVQDGLLVGLWHQERLVGEILRFRTNWIERSTELAYWLADTYQGRGFMTRACRAVIHHAFTELGLNRVEIRCATGNRRSRGIPERLGFSHEGTIRDAQWIQDRFVDHAVYGLLAREWGAPPHSASA